MDTPTAMLTDKEISDAMARCEKATPGPWSFVPAPEAWSAGGNTPNRVFNKTDPKNWLYVMSAGSEENLTFAAHARTDLPRALAEVQRLRTLLTKVDGFWQSLSRCKDQEQWKLLSARYDELREEVRNEVKLYAD